MSEPTDIRRALPKADRLRIALGLRVEGDALAKEIRSDFRYLRTEIASHCGGYLIYADRSNLGARLRWLADRLDELDRIGEQYRLLTNDVPWQELLTFRGKPLARNRGPERD
jgi:hypothetical protein